MYNCRNKASLIEQTVPLIINLQLTSYADLSIVKNSVVFYIHLSCRSSSNNLSVSLKEEFVPDTIGPLPKTIPPIFPSKDLKPCLLKEDHALPGTFFYLGWNLISLSNGYLFCLLKGIWHSQTQPILEETSTGEFLGKQFAQGDTVAGG